MLQNFKKKEIVGLNLHDLLIKMAGVKKNTDYIQAVSLTLVGKGKGHPCTGTDPLYRPYGP
jgi:hypothetical protein